MQRLGKNAVGWKYVVRPFEASLCEAPQDEPFSSISSTIHPHAEERPGAAGARLEARTTPNPVHSCPASQRNPPTGAARRAGVGLGFQARGKPGHQRAGPAEFATLACSRALTRAARRCRGDRIGPGARRRANRRRRRIARNWVRTRRAICAASVGAISPCATAARTIDSTCLQSSAVRNELRRIPRRSAGSIGARGGNIAWREAAADAAYGRADPTAPARSAALPEGQARRRMGLGMPGGRPRGLPDLPFAKRTRASRARGKNRSGSSC